MPVSAIFENISKGSKLISGPSLTIAIGMKGLVV
jgi:hypothetical protein